jgi:hypothetical protein
LETLDPGTYSINAYVPGFGFTTGSAVTFQSFNGATLDNDGVTGTVTVVNGNTATLAVTVPKVRSSATGDWLSLSASPGQNALTLNSIANVATGGNILVGDSLTINADAFYLTPETVTVTGITGDVVSITPALADSHTGNVSGVGAATITDNSDPQSTTDTVQADLTNGAGGVDLVNPFFTFSTAGTITASSLNPVGVGANAANETFTLSSATPDTTPLTDWTASSTQAGVTFGASTANTGGTISFPINVAQGTAPAASVPVSLTDGLETYTGTIAVVAGPTVTAVTGVGNLTAGSAGFTIGVTGTNFVVGDMSCTTSDPAVGCVVDSEPLTDSTTTATVSLTPGDAMLNGTDSLTLTYSGGGTPTEGAGTLAGAFTVSGQPTVTAIAPSTIPAGATPALTATGTLFAASMPSCSETITHVDTTTNTYGCTATDVSATSATITAYTAGVGGDSIVFTFGAADSVASSPAVAVQADPEQAFLIASSALNNFTSPSSIAVGSTAVPFKLIGSGYLAGATVTLSAGTATVTSVTPNAIFGTITIPSTVTGTFPLLDTATVTNANGGSSGAVDEFYVQAAPSITKPTVAAPKAILDGTATTLVITGTGFVSGAVVTGAVAGVDTFGTAVVTNSANAADLCTGLSSLVYPYVSDSCNTITVTVTPVSFSGSTPILDGLVVTNPVGAGSVTVQNDLTVNPVPAVTGTYYVPTFSSNVEITINGSGFETGITASSANPDYTVLAVASTPTTVTLLVSTDSNATSGTSSTITLTNPDGGSGTFPLNGGPNPNTVTPTPHATRVNGVVHTGKESTVVVLGTHFYGQPKITSNDKGTRVVVYRDLGGKQLWLHVWTLKTTKKGVHTFIIRFANGEQTSVKYNDVK